MLSIGSVFSGIGGLELGLEQAGLGPTLWQVEKDQFCRRVLATHWTHAEQHGDIRFVQGSDLRRVGVMGGGFPCTDVSYANSEGLGLDGPDSGLWREYARLIRWLRPGYVIVENVAALLARGLGDVLGDLAACGYAAEWDCLPASAFGAPHQRDRLFVVAYADRHPVPVFGEYAERLIRGSAAASPLAVDALDAHLRTARVRGSALADAHGAGLEERHATLVAAHAGLDPRGAAARWLHAGGPPEPILRRVADGVPDVVARLRALGNAIVPQVAEFIGRCIIERERVIAQRVKDSTRSEGFDEAAR